MHNRALLFFGTLFLAACYRAPTSEELVSKYTNAPDGYAKLRKMIEADIGQKQCFTIGLDHIGDYWEHSGQWTHQNDYKNKLSLQAVLKAVGLNEPRFNEYKKLFEVTGSERVSLCQGGKYGSWVTVLVYRAGLAVSGCSGDISWRDEPPRPQGKRGEGDFTEITPIKDGWYLEYSCT